MMIPAHAEHVFDPLSFPFLLLPRCTPLPSTHSTLPLLLSPPHCLVLSGVELLTDGAPESTEPYKLPTSSAPPSFPHRLVEAPPSLPHRLVEATSDRTEARLPSNQSSCRRVHSPIPHPQSRSIIWSQPTFFLPSSSKPRGPHNIPSFPSHTSPQCRLPTSLPTLAPTRTPCCLAS